jgi:hypothetical protein
MKTQITANWKDWLYQGLVGLWSGARHVVERMERDAPHGILRPRMLNRYFQRLMRQKVQEHRRLLTSAPDFPELDRAFKRRLLAMVRHHINRVAVADTWSDFVLSLMRWLNIVVLPVVCYFAFTSAYFRWGAWPLFTIDPAQFIAYWFVLLLIVSAGVHLFALPMYMLKVRGWRNFDLTPALDVYTNLYFHFWFNRAFMIAWPVGAVTACAVLYAALAPIAETAPPSLWWQAFAGAVVGVGLLAGLLGSTLATALSVGGLFSVVGYALQRRKRRLYPEAVVTLQLLRILILVAKTPATWGSPEMKYILVGRLERVASCLQYDLHHQLQSDIAMDSWFQRMGVQMAVAMRALKPWVLMPKPDTREHFIAQITDAFVHAAIGEWDALARSEDEPQARRERWRTRVTDVAWAVVIAILPLFGFWGIQQSPLAVPQPVAGYVTIGGLVWLVLMLR